MKYSGQTNRLIYSGTSGIAVPEQGKKAFPEAFRDKSRLEYYASLFNSIEINSTFRKMPLTKTVARWAAIVPPGFKFTFKFPGEVTHSKDLSFEPAFIARFLEVINNVGSKKGCLLIQFPGKFSVTQRKRLEHFLHSILTVDHEREWKISIEFRNHSWYTEDIFDFLQRSKISLVLHDLPPASPPLIDNFDFIYLRFHGPEKGYRGSYSNAFLSGYAQHVKRWSMLGKEVYIYFNNTLGQAAQNLITLKELVGA